MSHFSIRSHFDMLVNNLSKLFNKMILEARKKPILTMIETIRTKIMLLIVKKKEETDKWKGMLCPKIKKKLDVNIKDSLRCVASHVGGDKYQVECGSGIQHMVDLVENSYSCRNWDLTGIPCMYALAVIHLKDKFPETYVQTFSCSCRSKDIKLVSQLSNRLPQISKRVPQLNRLPQLSTYCPNLSTSYPKRKAPIQEKTNHC
ncbi:hypothetical protein GOBAR_AA00657 [Gossypium barbadense]|uniref:Zinc finger PMZ-type domain-containing protein n=1 Tax=Gossypium barbadense TaxID=3634 RepID=A0A2P5YWB7_GOSBA|nr:hypothetical protein GOBAR_AA00657 [Gossypium barbadense]